MRVATELRRSQASVAGATLVGRVPAILVAAAALCFLLPFATVSCDGEEAVTVTGLELAAGDIPPAVDVRGQEVSDDEFGSIVARFASPTTALALVALLLGAVAGLLRHRIAAPAGLLAGGLAAGALASLYLDSVFAVEMADRHSGYWLALSFSLAAALTAASRWPQRSEMRATRSTPAIMLALIGLGVLFAEVAFRTLDTSEPPLALYVYASALMAIALPVGVVVSCLLLSRRPGKGLAAGILLGLGAAGVLEAGWVIHQLSKDDLSDTSVSGRSLATILVGPLLILVAGAVAARGIRAERMISGTAAGLALAGAGLLLVATAVPFDGGGVAEPARGVFSIDDGVRSLAGLVSLGAALLALAATAVGSRAYGPTAAGVWISLGGATGLFFADLLYPLFASGEDVSFAPGAAIGLAGSTLLVLAGAAGVRRSARTGAALAWEPRP